MANMGYVRNQLTAGNLRECLEALHDKGLSGLSPSELGYAKILANLALKYVNAYNVAFKEYEAELNDGHTQTIDDAEALDVKRKYRDEYKNK